MRRVHLGSHAGFQKGFAVAVVPLLLFASSCSRSGEERVVAPRPEPERPRTAEVAAMRWVWEPEALAGAVHAAAKNPLVQRALVDAPVSALLARPDLAIRAVGEDTDGAPVGLTVIPYSVGGDRTHAAFVSVAQAHGREGAEFAELIVGREPRADEAGFEPIVLGSRIGWVRTGNAYELAPAGAHLAPVKRSWSKLFSCLVERMPLGCAAGANIAREAAPGVPHAAAVGCALGALGGAASCAFEFLGK